MEVMMEVPSIEGSKAEAATVVQWLKKEGDVVEKDEPLLVIEFPKTDFEIPAPTSGRLTKIIARPGRMVRIHDKVGIIQK